MKKFYLPILFIILTLILIGCSDIASGLEAIFTLFYLGLKWFLIIVVAFLIIGAIVALFNKNNK